MNMDWTLKIAAWLSRNPAFSLFPENSAEISRRLMKVVCQNVDLDELLNKASEIEQIASGMDIPPFAGNQQLDAACFRKNPVLTHPLSGQEHHLDLPPNLTQESMADHIEKTLVQMVDNVGAADQKKLFFALWRHFPDQLSANDPTSLGHFWKILPADPRIPSHTVWEHAAVSSAIAGAWPEPAFMIFTLASAQEMVATARRTQDAWMGSFLWSYLSWQAMSVIVDACGPDAVISPSLGGQPLVDWWLGKTLNLPSIQQADEEFKKLLEVGNIPNMFTAIVPAGQAKELAEKCEQAIQKAWKNIAHKVREKVAQACKNQKIDIDHIDSWDAIWQRQSEAFIKNQGVFWTACPWKNSFEDILDAKDKAGDNSLSISQLKSMISNMKSHGHQPHIGMAAHLLTSFAGREMTARKNLRDFVQTEEPGFKCSLCGKWEALHPAAAYNYADLREFWEKLRQIDRDEENLKLAGRIRRGDMLCSICLIRRLALEAVFEEEMGINHHQFPSTTGIATSAYRGHLLKACEKSPQLREALTDYSNTVSKFVKNRFPYPANSTSYLDGCAAQSGIERNIWKKFLRLDGDWLSPESYDEKIIKEDKTLNREQLENCRKATEKLLRSAKETAADNKIKLGDPPGYYAILALDGDKMGDWVIGTKAPLSRWLFHPDVRKTEFIQNIVPDGFLRPAGPAMQLALSGSLKNFTLHYARDIVEKNHAGKLVYAGGDDLLAFLPTEHLLPVMRQLYKSFRGISDGFGQEKGELLRLSGGSRHSIEADFHHEGVTPSMGVVIVHHSYPLYHAMAEAQSVLKEAAKKKLARNAFAFRLLRRSGEPTEGGFKFNAGEKECAADVIYLLENIMTFIKNDKLSGRLPYAMGMHRWAVSGNQDYHDQEMNELRRAELARITGRMIKSNLPDSEKKEIKNKVLNLFDTIAAKKELAVNPWDMTARLLLILRFMTGKER